jgi:hypothetical protein
MKKGLLVSVLLSTLLLLMAPTWGQTERTLYGIPSGWTVTVDGLYVTPINGNVSALPGQEVKLFPPDPVPAPDKKVESVGVTGVPLTFEAAVAGSTVSFDLVNGISGVEYSIDGGVTWLSYSDNSPITLTNIGDIVMFRGNNSSYYQNNTASKFSCSDNCYVYGNIMSLVSSTEFTTANRVSNNAFRQLFNNNTHILNHSTKSLELPADTLGNNSYNNMFHGCTGLTRVPKLPATTLGNYCYQNMFNGCSGLTTLPEDLLQATTLTPACYNAMFYGCTGLTNVPNLPATTLTERCYMNMFNGCTSLTSVPANLLSATILPPPNANSEGGCYEKMFQNCTSLQASPVLPATTLTEKCYKEMFYGCSNLTSVTCLATDISASSCTSDWLNNVAAAGTFTKAASMSSWAASSTSGIPDGWTTQDYVNQ